jgi:ribosomal-protein-alanine N-acetyltransferase
VFSFLSENKVFNLFAKPSFIIKAGVTSQAKAIAKIHTANFAHGWSENDILSMMSDKNTLCLVAENSKSHSIAGFIIVKTVLDEAEILTIAVDKKYQNQKLGSQLLEKSLPELKMRGVKSFFLEVANDNQAALKLYTRFNFKQVGTRKGY